MINYEVNRIGIIVVIDRAPEDVAVQARLVPAVGSTQTGRWELET